MNDDLLNIIIKIIIPIILFLIIIILLLIIHKSKLIKNKYYYNYVADPLIRVDDTYIGTRNIVYRPKTHVAKAITEYAISFDNKNYILINYAYNFNQITYYIVVYNYLHIPIKVIKVDDTRKSGHSTLIKLPQKTHDVNIIVTKVEGENVNHKPIKRFGFIRCLIYSILRTLLFTLNLTFLLFVITLSLLSDAYVFTSSMIYTLIASVIYFLMVFIIIKIKNRKEHVKDVDKDGL